MDELCDPDDEDFEVNTSQLTKSTKHLLNHFWRRWRSEYLSELRACHRYVVKKASCPTHVTKGDPRPCPATWPQEVRTDPGSVHWLRWSISQCSCKGCQLRLTTTLLKRPLQLLYPLEISEHELLGTPPENVPASCDLTSWAVSCQCDLTSEALMPK